MTTLKKVYYGAAATLIGMFLPAICMAQEAEGGGGEGFSSTSLIALASAFAISIAALGGALAQGRAAASAFESMARNPGVQPKIFTSMILGLAFIESLVIYALLIAFLLVFKVK
jgi:F-type H+-transporting ATPase subunit c